MKKISEQMMGHHFTPIKKSRHIMQRTELLFIFLWYSLSLSLSPREKSIGKLFCGLNLQISISGKSCFLKVVTDKAQSLRIIKALVRHFLEMFQFFLDFILVPRELFKKKIRTSMKKKCQIKNLLFVAPPDFCLSLNKLQYADRVRIFVLGQQHHRRCWKANTLGGKEGYWVLLYKKCKPIVAENVGFSGFVLRAKIVLLFP